MNFLINFFSCNQFNSRRKKSVSFNTLCVNGNCKYEIQKEREKDNGKVKSLTLRTMSNSCRLASSMTDPIPKKNPQTKHLILKGCFNKRQKNIDWGFLVGMVNYKAIQQSIIPNSIIKLAIGRNQQLNSLMGIRKYSLDKLVIFWGEFNQDYTINHFIRCHQNLIFILQDWSLLLQLLKNYEEELLKTLGELCLLESNNKILFNIITYQNKYIIQFEQADKFIEYAKQILEKIQDITLTQENLHSLLEKMTLNDYIDLKKNSQSISRKIKHYLIQIDRQNCQKQTCPLDAEELKSQIQNLSQSEEHVQGLRKQSKSSDAQLEAQYYASRRIAEEQTVKQNLAQINQEDQNLLIYNLNNDSETQQLQQAKAAQPSSRSTLFRKIRSKSQDATYIPDQNIYLDDQFFLKYQ